MDSNYQYAFFRFPSLFLFVDSAEELVMHLGEGTIMIKRALPSEEKEKKRTKMHNTKSAYRYMNAINDQSIRD